MRGSLGEVAVGFTFAPSVNDESEDGTGPPSNGGCGLWPVFVLHGNGSVYCLVTGLGSSKPEGGSRYDAGSSFILSLPLYLAHRQDAIKNVDQ